MGKRNRQEPEGQLASPLLPPEWPMYFDLKEPLILKVDSTITLLLATPESVSIVGGFHWNYFIYWFTWFIVHLPYWTFAPRGQGHCPPRSLVRPEWASKDPPVWGQCWALVVS